MSTNDFLWAPPIVLFSEINFQVMQKFQIILSMLRSFQAVQICSNAELIDICDVSLPALNHLVYFCDRQRTPLRDTDRLGNESQWVPFFVSCCSWMFQNSYGTGSTLWPQKKFSKFRQSTQIAWLPPAKILGKFLSDPPFNFFRNLGHVLFSHPGIKCVLWLIVSCIFRCFSGNCR